MQVHAEAAAAGARYLGVGQEQPGGGDGLPIRVGDEMERGIEGVVRVDLARRSGGGCEEI